MHDSLISATISALKSIRRPRYFENERGYQGQFYHILHGKLEEQGVFSNTGLILTEEHQKSSRSHGTRQRPDIILHAPRNETGAEVYENNIAVWALKLNATFDEAKEDFRKLDEMFKHLHYPLGIFINLNSASHYISSYEGDYPDRIVEFAVRLEDGEAVISRAQRR
jgi:hypothetical protein